MEYCNDLFFRSNLYKTTVFHSAAFLTTTQNTMHVFYLMVIKQLLTGLITFLMA